MSVPFCRDCKHRIPYDGDPSAIHLSRCGKAPIQQEADYYVTGIRTGEFSYCSVARISDPCGKDGKLFEPVDIPVVAA